ncbi:hypothetical protein [Pantoea phage LIMEzero]|uniref:Uncharacterized protein n=1 Tax=Pantoea phage LIMEzero TaxID=943335 RepID=F4N9R2_9CAUD|nr:hypothetical protein LIMEzero_ORF09 [Pantoea phage LIMEzero]CBY88540.1 hypothetical protein [Pantoea phage LIMEzero]
MSNIYFVCSVKSDAVVGLAVEEGGKYISTDYVATGKTGASAPTTVDALEASIASGAVPVPPAGLVHLALGISLELTLSLLTEQVGEPVYMEHALVV